MRFVPWAGLALVGALVQASFVGCGNGDAPLGGPHGGTGSPPDPGPGNFQSSLVDGGVVAILDAGVDGVAAETGLPPGDAAGVNDGGGTGLDAGAPTWATIFVAYMPMCKTCHAEMGTAESSYAWLMSQGFIAGAFSPLVSPAQSCLSWYGGDMPPGGAGNPAAVAAMNAWAAAGALGPPVSDN